MELEWFGSHGVGLMDVTGAKSFTPSCRASTPNCWSVKACTCSWLLLVVIHQTQGRFSVSDWPAQ